MKSYVFNLISCLLLISFITFDSISFRFADILLVVTLNIIVCKFSLFSLFSVILFMPVVSMYFQVQTGKSYGLLEISTYELHYQLMFLCIFACLLILLLYTNNTSILDHEKQVLKFHDSRESLLGAYFCATLAICSAIVAFPSLPFTRGFSTSSLLPGNAWNHLAIVGLMFSFEKAKKSKYIRFCFVFVIIWFISHFERVDIISFILGLVLVLLVRNNIRVRIKTVIRYCIFILLALIAMVYIGEVRAGNSSISFFDLLRKLVVQNTATDVAYVFNLSAEYYEHFQLLHGETYISYLYSIFPTLDSPITVPNIIKTISFSPGGEYYISEPLINFGIAGVVLIFIVELLVVSLIIRRHTPYCFYVYLFILCTQFRIIWYGRSFIETALIYFIPICYFVTHKIFSRKAYL